MTSTKPLFLIGGCNYPDNSRIVSVCVPRYLSPVSLRWEDLRYQRIRDSHRGGRSVNSGLSSSRRHPPSHCYRPDVSPSVTLVFDTFLYPSHSCIHIKRIYMSLIPETLVVHTCLLQEPDTSSPDCRRTPYPTDHPKKQTKQKK